MRIFLLLLLNIVLYYSAQTQDSLTFSEKIFNLPDKLFGSIERKSEKLQQQLYKSTAKSLNKLERSEIKMKKKLMKEDSTLAKEVFGNVKEKYGAMRSRLNDPTAIVGAQQKDYVRKLDSLQTALKFVDQLSSKSKDLSNINPRINGALQQYNGIQDKLNKTRDIQQLLVDRQQLIKNRLVNTGLSKQYRSYQQQIYYYRDRIKNYKESLTDPSKVEKELLKHAARIPAFENFFNKHSDLASLFRLPQSDEPLPATALLGLQTRDMLAAQLQQRFGSGSASQQYVSSGIADAQAGLTTIKDRLQQLGSSGENMDMPDFKPNPEKSKTFLQRLVIGTSIQSVKSNYFFPSTTDLAVSAGYKFSEKAIVGTGIGYKMGWGRDIRNIDISHEGVSMRSFLDIHLKKSFWLSGGFEMNYLSNFKHIQQLKDMSDWQRSGLIGLTKKVSLKNKFLKNTKIQLLWDFLSYSQKPATQAIIYRIGYDF